MVSTVIMVSMVATTFVSAAFRLEWGLHLYKLRSEAKEYLLDHMIGSNAKNLVVNFGRQMPISQMPCKAHQLIGFFVPHFNDILMSGPDHQQPPVRKLHGISFGHGNGFRKEQEESPRPDP
jgi:hypothetical protein